MCDRLGVLISIKIGPFVFDAAFRVSATIIGSGLQHQYGILQDWAKHFKSGGDGSQPITVTPADCIDVAIS